MKRLLAAIAVTAALAPLSLNAAEIGASAEARNALLERELLDQDLANQLAPIKSHEDLRFYLAKNRGNRTPLQSLSAGARQRFVQSLVFTGKGLASFDYSDLSSELSASQAYSLLSLFGVQHTTRLIPGLRANSAADVTILSQRHDGVLRPQKDYYNYKCTPPATCTSNWNTICISQNCLPP